MFATGLGLMILGIEKGEDIQALKTEQEHPTPKKKAFKEPVSTPRSETQKEEKPEKYYRPWEKLKDTLSMLITDDEDDDF